MTPTGPFLADAGEPLAESRPSAARVPLAWRYVAFGMAWVWCAALAWIWIGAPWWIRLAGLGWALLGVVRPALFFGSLALALPWFGDQPSWTNAKLVLIEMALLGPVIHYQLRRALGLAPPRPQRLDPWLLLFVYWSWITVATQWRFIQCEWDVERWGFLYTNLRHYGTSPTFGFQAAFKLSLGVALYQMLRDQPWGARRLRHFLLLALAGLAVASLLGAANFVHWIPLDWWRPDNPELARFRFRRLQSLFGHSGWFAQYLALLAPAALAMGLAAPARWQRWTGWLLAAALVPVQVLTQARGGWADLTAGYAVVACMAALAGGGAARRRRLAFAAGALALLLAGGGGAVYAFSPDFRLRLTELFAFGDRTQIWMSAWELARGNRLTGIGLGYYYYFQTLCFPPGHPFYHLDKVTAHNLGLHILAERGAIGLALFSAWVLAGLWSLLAAIRRSAGAPDRNGLPRDLMLAILGGLTAFLVDGLIQYPFFVRVVGLLFWILLGAASWCGPPVVAARTTRPGRWGVLALLAGLPVLYLTSHGVFQPYLIGLDGENLRAGADVVELSVPQQGERFRLVLGAIQPDLENQPQTLTVRYDGREVARVEFRKLGAQRIELTLPRDRPPGQRLQIAASRVWRPLRDSGQRLPPLLRIGVIYLPLQPVPPASGPP